MKYDLMWASIRRGNYNGIPQCCTLWFFVRVLTGWVAFLSRHSFIRNLWGSITIGKPFGWERPEAYQYIRCPVCALLGRFVEMHLCDDNCSPI